MNAKYKSILLEYYEKLAEEIAIEQYKIYKKWCADIILMCSVKIMPPRMVSMIHIPQEFYDNLMAVAKGEWEDLPAINRALFINEAKGITKMLVGTNHINLMNDVQQRLDAAAAAGG